MDPVEDQLYIQNQGVSNGNILTEMLLNLLNDGSAVPRSNAYSDEALYSNQQDQNFYVQEQDVYYVDGLPMAVMPEVTQTQLSTPDSIEPPSILEEDYYELNFWFTQDNLSNGFTGMGDWLLPSYNPNIERGHDLNSLAISSNMDQPYRLSQYEYTTPDSYRGTQVSKPDPSMQPIGQTAAIVPSINKDFGFINKCSNCFPKTYHRSLSRTFLACNFCSPYNVDICGNQIQNDGPSTTEMFSCQTCEHQFNRKSNFTRHLERHIKDRKKSRCSLCKKKFVSNFNVKRHRKICKMA
ncbi:hypothetical protein J3Q64DRAFT_1701257 [Phycomyces blakesleeanus]|uniref:C2H2-type domain-containing protein n=1 Tax=Phycomyces blakesleeanus TaxID=4837 RepID=A0ABR3AT47_PHYBL